MNSPLSVINFLNSIDKERKIERNHAILDITSITLHQTFTDASRLLNKEDREKLVALLSDPSKLSIKAMYQLFDSAGKLRDLIEISEKVSSEVRQDYLKTQFGALSQKNKELVLQKFPELKKLVY